MAQKVHKVVKQQNQVQKKEAAIQVVKLKYIRHGLNKQIRISVTLFKLVRRRRY